MAPSLIGKCFLKRTLLGLGLVSVVSRLGIVRHRRVVSDDGSFVIVFVVLLVSTREESVFISTMVA